MKMLLLTLSCVVLLFSFPSAQEKITIGSPVAQPSITDYSPVFLHIEIDPNPFISVGIKGQDGKVQVFNYPNTVAAYDTSAEVLALINGLKVANLSTAYAGNASSGNLWQRVFFRLTTDFPSRFNGGGTVQ